jgi:ADP-ribose pyrophosphatase YjhB (NUDIX family)
MAGEEENHVSCPCFHEWIAKKATAHAGVGVVNSRKEILVLEKASGPRRGYWALASGFIERGERPIEAAKRELEEETGIVLELARLSEVCTVTADLDDRTDIVVTYAAYPVDPTGEIELDNKEHSDSRWVFLYGRELDQLAMVPATREQLSSIRMHIG